MTFKWYIIIGIFLLITYFFFPVFFGLGVLFIILYITYRVYKIVQRFRTPHGKRIKHKLLHGYLTERYGKEGNSIYKEMVQELKNKGYR
jgi:predicted membrane protein